MTTATRDLCPCGSGKRYKHCHQARDQATRRRRLLLFAGGGAAVAALALVVFALNRGPGRAGVAGPGDSVAVGVDGPAPTGAFGRVLPGAGGVPPIPSQAGAPVAVQGDRGALAPGESPAPWHYDIENNRHYDPRPGHQHWHDGPPPADLDPSGQVSVQASPGNAQNLDITSSTGVQVTPSTALTPGENPKPWEYDPVQNRYFDPTPGHNHWHPGRPPANPAPAPAPAPGGASSP